MQQTSTTPLFAKSEKAELARRKRMEARNVKIAAAIAAGDRRTIGNVCGKQWVK